MKCVMCDNPKSLKTKAITIKYKESGLENVTLHGVEAHKCGRCGEEYYGFGDLEQLHGLIARVLVFKKGLLNGKELRFLRTYLGFSGSVFAERVGIAKETLSRFENNKQPMTKTFDLLVRALVTTKLPNRDYDSHDWWLNQQRKSLKQIELNAKNGGWELKEAA